MKRRLFVSTATALATTRRPNVTFILADDLGWRDTGGTGSSLQRDAEHRPAGHARHAFHPGLRGLPLVLAHPRQHSHRPVARAPRHHLASEEPARVKQLNALIDGFLARSGTIVPKANPAYARAAPRA